MRLFNDSIDRVDQVFGTDSNTQGDEDKCDSGRDGRQNLGFLVFLSILLLLVKQVGVSLELEEKVETVKNEHDDGRSMRKDEDVVVSALLRVGKGGVEGGRDDQAGRGDCHQGGHG